MKNFLTLIGANVPTAAVCTAKSPQNSGGGSSQCSTSRSIGAQSFTLRSIGAQYFTRFLGSSCRVWRYVACMLLALVLGVGQMWGTLTAHTPGVYEKAVANGGYGIGLTTYSGSQYEVYYFSANSKYGSVNNVSGTGHQYRLMCADADSEYVLFGDDKPHTSDSDDKNGQKPYAFSCDWIETNFATTGFAKSDYTYGSNKFNEFFAITPNGGNSGYTKTCWIKPKAGDSFTLKVSGYVEFGILGVDNSSTKYVKVSVDGGDNVLPKSSVDSENKPVLERRAVSLTTGEHTIVVSIEGSSACNIYGFSLKLPAAGNTLVYNANGGEGTMSNTVGTGSVTLTTNTYTKSGCSFLGWATSQDLANAGTVAYTDGAAYTLSADATLYAVWKLNAPEISCEDNVVTMTVPSGSTVYYTTDGSTDPTSSSTPYNPYSKPVIDATTTFKAIAILANHVSSNITTQECVYAAALPEVDAPTGLSSTAQTATSLTFGWTAAEHASSYDVYLYTDEGCLSLAIPTESNPQNVTTTSATFTGLTVSTTYYCKVQSKGDGTGYKVNGGITAAASAETPCTAITPTWVYPFTKIAVGITPSNPVDGNLGEGAVSYTSSASSYLDPSNAHWAKAAGSAKITADVAAGGNYCSGSVTSGTIEVVADQTGIITQTLATGNTAWSASTPTTTDGTNITNLVALHAVGDGYTISTSSNNGNGNNGGQTAKVPGVNATSCDNTKYLEMSFSVAAGKQLNVSAIYIPVQPVSSNTGKFKAILSDGTTDIEGTVSNITNGKLDYIRFTSFGTVRGDVTLRIYAWNWSAGYRMGRNVIIAGEVETIPVSSYDITYTAPSNGSYTIQVGEAAAVSANTTANNGQTITLAATPVSGYRLSAWDVYKTGESTTKVSVSNNTFTMPAYAVTVSATFETIPTINDLVTIADDYTFTPSATIAALTLAEDNKFLAVGDGCTYGSKGLLVKENRALAFKVNNGAKVKVTFTEKSDDTTPREMQLGTAASDDDNKAYGHSGESPATFTVTADGVVYLTASKDLSFSQLEIIYPHTVTYALNGGDGTLPTEGAHYKGDKFNVHNGTTGITAPENKEFSVWSDGTSTYAGGTQYTMGSANVTLTAQWITALPLPTITFNNGAYTIGGSALNLSTLFTSNSDGAVTYSVKTAGETGAAIDGTSFTATAAGSAVVTASQAATASYKAKSVDATITISAPSEVDGIKLVEDGVLTGNFRTSASLSSTAHTVAGIAYPKYIGLSARTSWSSQPSGPDNYLLQYTLTKKTNKFYFYAYNTNGGVQNVKVYVKEEGENCTTTNVPVSANSGELVSCDVNVSKNAEVCISVSATSLHICQVVVVESGDDQLVAPAVNYNINFNKGRLTAKSGTAKTFEGITYCNNADYKIDNSTSLKLTTRGTHYVSFEIPTGQTRKLQVTTGGSAYNVSKTLGDNTTATKTGNHDFNLGAGVWYINPQGSDVTITNLKFIAADAAITVTFNSNGGSDIDAQALFAGDVVTEPSPAPTKSGYRFVKWQKAGADYDFDYTLVAGDAPGFTLEAVWQETVTVTFAPANGEDNFTKTADKGATLAAGDRPADPVYAGHVFQGWTRNASADPVTYVNLASETFSADATLTAVWEVAQTDATISALSYNGNAINVASAEDVAGVATYTVHLQWGTTIDKDLISVTKAASSATVGTIAYDSEAKKATFTVTAGDGTTTADYAIQFVIDAKRGTSIIKAVTANNTVTGLIGGTRNTNLSNGASKKLNTETYFGMTLAGDETFQEGDVIIINITAAADLGKFMVYADAERTQLVADQGIVYTKPTATVPVLCPTGEMMMTLPAAANGKKSLYISREDGNTQWNVTFSSLEVVREMNPVIKSFKFGDDAATINESAKTISIDVPYGTAVTALTPTVEAYGNNGTTYTPDGATDFTSPVDYVVKDAYNEFSTTYTVTVNVAAPSENANLASLSVAGYALDFNKATTTYNVVLDYGTTALPEITYAVEDAGLANAVKVEDGVNGATTITVTPQAGAGYEKVYTINFTVSTTPKFVIYDGSTMTDYAESGFDVGTEFAWSVTGGSHSAKNISVTLNGKTYTKAQNIFTSPTKGPDAGNTRFIEITIPEGYVAKFYLVGATNDDGSIRSSYISKEKTGTLDESIAYASTDSYDGVAMRSGYQMPGTYYYCSDASIRLYELSVTLYPAHMRNATVGKMATVCLPNNVEADGIIGAEVYELLYWKYGTSYADCQMVDFGEVTSMEEGHAYLFIPTADKVAFVLGNNVAPDPVVVSGFTGTYEPIAAAYDNVLHGKYGVVNNMIQKLGHNCYSAANRAYIDLSLTPSKDAYDAQPHMTNHAPRKRVSLGHKITTEEEPIATGLDAINVENADVQKVLINGEMFIIRDGHIYSATGMMVK